jgi:hypothetical protein
MKKIFIAMILVLISNYSSAAIVKSASVDEKGENLLVEVTYSGGCGAHRFNLKYDGCFATTPAACEVMLVEKTKDFCEKLIHETLTFSLTTYKLNELPFKGSLLTIFGAFDLSSKAPSRVSVQLP